MRTKQDDNHSFFAWNAETPAIHKETNSKARTTRSFLYKTLFFKIESSKNHVTKLLQKSTKQLFSDRKRHEKRTFFMENPFKTRDFTLKKRSKQTKFNLKPSDFDVHEDEKDATAKRKYILSRQQRMKSNQKQTRAGNVFRQTGIRNRLRRSANVKTEIKETKSGTWKIKTMTERKRTGIRNPKKGTELLIPFSKYAKTIQKIISE